MRIKFKNIGTTLVVFLHGEIDHHWAEYFKNKVDGEILNSKTRNVIFDFEKVSFMDSSGIGAIIGRFKNIKSIRGRLLVVNVKGQLLRLFNMAGLGKLVPVCDNLDAALSMVRRESA